MEELQKILTGVLYLLCEREKDQMKADATDHTLNATDPCKARAASINKYVLIVKHKIV